MLCQLPFFSALSATGIKSYWVKYLDFHVGVRFNLVFLVSSMGGEAIALPVGEFLPLERIKLGFAIH